MKSILESLKRKEQATFFIKTEYLLEEDQKFVEYLRQHEFDDKMDLHADIELVKLVKVEDWFKDGTTICKTLRKGKGRNPYSDSTVRMRLRIAVNGEQVYSNYPETDTPIEEQEDFRDMTIE